jgi:hypothetical protein
MRSRKREQYNILKTKAACQSLPDKPALKTAREGGNRMGDVGYRRQERSEGKKKKSDLQTKTARPHAQ